MAEIVKVVILRVYVEDDCIDCDLVDDIKDIMNEGGYTIKSVDVDGNESSDNVVMGEDKSE